ncbi:hypothetical protein L1887_33569 [Cichorium endivia]|nr:hypothetical protein L1887_33569 [Cichorium endivia]
MVKDRISALPQAIIEKILTRMPIRDALRTSILSRKWRYSWTSMPILVFDDKLINRSSDNEEINEYKLVNAIFQVLLLHTGPILEFNISITHDTKVVDAIDQIMLHLSRRVNIKKLIFKIQSKNGYENLFSKRYKLPSLFFSLRGLDHVDLTCCEIKLPLTFNGFIMLRSPSYAMLTSVQRRFNDYLPIAHYLRKLYLPYIKHLFAGGMQKLHTSLVHLRIFFLDVCFLKQDELSFALSMISSSPNLEKIKIQLCWNHKLCGQQTLKNLLDFEKDYPGLNLDHLKEFEITSFHDYAPEREFVKLIMAKSPVLKKARIELNFDVSVDDEVKMLRDLVRLPFPRASTAANVIIERRK